MALLEQLIGIPKDPIDSLPPIEIPNCAPVIQPVAEQGVIFDGMTGAVAESATTVGFIGQLSMASIALL